MPDAPSTIAARLRARGTDILRAAAGALVVALAGLVLAITASALLGRAPHTGLAATQALALAALAGGAVLGALPDWVRRGTWRRGAAAALALLVGVGVCEAQAALAAPLLADGPELAVPLALALVAAPLFTRASRVAPLITGRKQRAHAESRGRASSGRTDGELTESS